MGCRNKMPSGNCKTKKPVTATVSWTAHLTSWITYSTRPSTSTQPDIEGISQMKNLPEVKAFVTYALKLQVWDVFARKDFCLKS
jgi:hypothetical protein